MHRHFSVFLAISLAVVCFLQTWASAAPLRVSVNGTERTLYEERAALLIGASDYSNGWTPLTNIPSELDDLESVLVRQGFIVRRAVDPTGSNLLTTIRDFLIEYGRPNTAIMVVFSGHGWTDRSTSVGYIVAVDAPLPAPDNQELFLRRAVSMSEVRTLAIQSRALHTFFVFDSCFSGSVFLSRSENRMPRRGRNDAAYFEVLRHRGVQVLTAGDQNQRVPARSRFMPSFIAGIQGEAGADHNGDGRITALELALWFRQSVDITPQTPMFGDIGDHHMDGDFVFQSAAESPMQAVQPDDPNALFRRAYALAGGRDGVPRDEVEAVRLYRLAADQGHAGAQTNLGFMYEHGRGVPRSHEEAVRLYRLAADQGHAWAQHNLGFMYATGRGISRDDAEAARFYRLAADQGHGGAQNNLGFHYEYGLGVERDYAQAVRWYRLAADQGRADGQDSLGFVYEHGRGVTRDYHEAVRLYQLAADQGDASAQFNLGSMYARGLGVNRDDSEAVRLFRLAARQENEAAQIELKRRGEGW